MKKNDLRITWTFLFLFKQRKVYAFLYSTSSILLPGRLINHERKGTYEKVVDTAHCVRGKNHGKHGK
ncbi:MAG: hypothetical protein Q4C03_07435, partial [bacterium]|nr:hypothetical protein [bacterium]